LCLIGGCSLAKVGDLRLAGIEVVDPVRQPIPGELNGWNSNGRLVKLTFTTNTNIRDVTRTDGLHLLVRPYFCANERQDLWTMQILFDADGAILKDPTPSSSSDGSAVWFYVAESSATRLTIDAHTLGIPAYDLARQPGDVCVQLRGQKTAFGGFYSNIVTISSAELSEALTKAD
jgi:hypothetical protein